MLGVHLTPLYALPLLLTTTGVSTTGRGRFWYSAVTDLQRDGMVPDQKRSPEAWLSGDQIPRSKFIRSPLISKMYSAASVVNRIVRFRTVSYNGQFAKVANIRPYRKGWFVRWSVSTVGINRRRRPISERDTGLAS